MVSLLFIGALACLHLVSSQCTFETLNDSTLVGRLLARSLVASTQSTPPTVTVRGHAVVCLAVSTLIDQYRFASVVVSYDCTGTCPGGTSGVLSQVEFGCNNNVWSEVVSGTDENNIQTPPAQATLQTQLRRDCHTCLNPGRELNSMEPNHCVSCSGCLPPDEGLNICTGGDASQCCNVNITGQCRQTCPSGTIPDPRFICRANCTDPLPTELNQQIGAPTCTYVGCTATYTCNDNLTLSDLSSTSYQLSCLPGSNAFIANWDPNTRTCSQRCEFVHDDDARARGIMIEYDPPGCNTTFGNTDCNATYTHNTERASCICMRNDTTGLISCSSDSVADLLAGVPTISTMSDNSAVIIGASVGGAIAGVLVVAGVVTIIVLVIVYVKPC